VSSEQPAAAAAATEPGSVCSEGTHRRGYVALGATILVGLALTLLVVWAFSPPPAPVETETTPIAGNRNADNSNVVPPDPPAKTPDPSSPPEAKKQAPTKTPSLVIDPRWIPPGTQAVLSLRLAEVRRQDELAQLLWRSDPLWKHGLHPLICGLELSRGNVQRVTWATTDVRDVARQSLLIVELSEGMSDSDAGKWLKQLNAQECDFTLGDAACHQRTEGLWTHPFALVAPHVLVSGPMALLRELAKAGPGVARAAAVLEQLVALAGQERELVLLADVEALRAAKHDLPAMWLEGHAELQEQWRAVGSLARGAALQVGFDGGFHGEVQALCASENAAQSAQAALEKLLRLLPGVLGQAAQAFLERAEARDLDAAVFTEALRALGQPKAGQRDNVAWAQLSSSTELSVLVSTAWTSWQVWEFIHCEPERVEPRLAVDVSGLELKLSEVEYRQVPLAGFVEELSRLAKVPMALDLDALAEVGLGQETKISVKQSGATVAAVLRAAIEPHALDYVLDDQGLLITTQARLRDQPRVVQYDVSDLAADAAAAKALAELCQRLVEPASWKAPGAQASLTVAGGKLLVRQSGPVHDDLLLFLERLRVARGRPAQRLTGVKLESRFARGRDRLQKEVTANFSQPTSLARIADYLGQRAGARLLIDSVALHKAGFDPAEGVTLTADKEPLVEVLGKLTESLDVGWRIVDDKTLQITSRLAAGRGELEFYAVADLLGAGITAEALAAQVQARVASETWAPTGQGVLHYDAASRHLIVLHSQAAQIRVEDFLATERAKKTAKPEDPPPERKTGK
jgi:hypothetical protein